MDLEYKTFPFTDVKTAPDGNGTLEGYVAVFGNVDLQNDVVEPGAFGAALADFLKSGFISWGHDWDVPVATISTASEDDHGLYLSAEYHSTPVAQEKRVITAERLARGKTMGLSIGYAVNPGGAQKDASGVRHLTDLTVYEGGLTIVPANPLAEVTAAKNAKGGPHGPLGTADAPVTHTHGHAAMGSQGDDATHEHEHQHAGDAGHDHSHEKSAGRQLSLVRLGAKKAVGRHTTETSDKSWDGTAVESSIPADATAATLKGFYAWQDPDKDAATKAAYRFVHHFSANGKAGAASTIACSTGIGVLNGGRGGTTIPKADIAGVYAHLAGHLKDAGKEPPELAKALRDLERKYMDVGDYGKPFTYELPGSYEELQEDLQEAASQALPGWSAGPLAGLLDVDDAYDWMNACVCLVATFDGECILYVQSDPWDDPDDGLYLRVPYQQGANGEPVLGTPELMQPAFIPLRAAPQVEVASRWSRFKRHASGLLVATRRIGRKEGRVLSGANRQMLSDCSEQLKQAASMLDDLLSATEPPEKADGRAVYAAHLREEARRKGVAI